MQGRDDVARLVLNHLYFDPCRQQSTTARQAIFHTFDDAHGVLARLAADLKNDGRTTIEPRHWRCRAHLEAITHSEGVKAPKRRPIEEYAGEGTFATLNEEWEPRPGNYPPDLWEIYAAAKGIESPHIELDGPWWRKGQE